MKIQTKLNIVFMLCSFLFVGVILSFYITEKNGIETIFKIDFKNKEEVFDRVSSLIGYSLDTYVYDYTYWDEMVDFVKFGDKTWAENNIDASLSTYKANAAWIYGLDKNVLYRAQDLDDSFYDVLPVPKDEIGRLFGNSPFCHFFVNTPQGIMEISGATIHPSQDKERKTPATGYFFAGRLWDGDFLKSLSKASSTSVAIVAGSTVATTEVNAKKGVMTFSRTLTGWNGIPVATLMVQTRSKIIPAVNDFSRA
ncbi:MAG: CHASE4 domain-containing protein, partial [Candidatus Omnitrophota bacterium]